MSMRIDCEQVRELLSSLVDGELSSAQRKIVSAHMLTCDECSTFGGRILAAKGIVLRDEPEADAPAEFFERMQERLDAVEGVRHQVRRPGPARRMTAIAAMGAIAVRVALILSTVYYINTARALTLAQMHQQITAMPGPMPGGDGYSTVSCDPSSDNWSQVHQALATVDGVRGTYRLYRVGSCPVSIYSGPADWEPYREGWLVTERINGLDVREVGGYAMTSWDQAGRRHVMVAQTSPRDIAMLARVQMSLSGRSSTF